MNFIIVISDTLRRDHLGCYGNEWISTPNMDRLAKESVIFDRAYTGSFPTIPNRRDLFTGRFTFTYSDWAPLPPDEVVLAQVLREAGYTTMFIADTPHLVKDGFHYDRGFSGWNWIRGQEGDRYMTDPIEVKLPCSPEKLRETAKTVTQYLRNVSQRQYEEDYFAPRTMSEAGRWLERNYKQEKFLLYVDTFDPHEPWDPPKWYADMYDPGYEGEELIYPPVYGPCNYLTAAELKHIRALYAGEVTMVDRWLGILLQKVEALGLLENTAIIFTTDHGFYFGEHGLIGKTRMLYEEVNHIPLMIRMPGKAGGERNLDFVQPADLMPTILELADVGIPNTVHGKSLVPLLKGTGPGARNFAVSSWAIIHPPAGERVDFASQAYSWAKAARDTRPSTIVDSEWTLLFGAGDVEPELYHLPSDPQQRTNVFAKHPGEAKRLHSQFVRFLESVGTAEEYLKPRRTL